LSRHSQPVRRLPFGLSETREHLLRQIGRHGLSGLFDEEVTASRPGPGPEGSAQFVAAAVDGQEKGRA
jgi:hypothetical protein